jgi:hypothetical protein
MKELIRTNSELSELVSQKSARIIFLESLLNLTIEGLKRIDETGDPRIAQKCLFEVEELGQK